LTRQVGLTYDRRVIQLALLLATLTAAPPLDQAGAVARALAQHPQVRAAQARVEAARARQIQAAALPNPNLLMAVDQVPLANPGAGNFMLGASQPLLAAGQRDARTEAARIELAQAEAELAVQRQDLALRVKEAYARVLYDRAVRELVIHAVEADKAAVERAGKRYQAGELARVEVLRAEVERDRTAREAVAAIGRVIQAEGRLETLIGPWPQGLADPGPVAVPSMPDLTTRALAARKELLQAKLAIDREAVQRRLAQAALWTGTELSLSGGLVSGQPGFSTSLAVPVPFYRQQGEVAEAQANEARAAAEREALEAQIRLEVRVAVTDWTVAAEQVRLFAKSYLPQARRLVENAQKRFDAGEGSASEVLEARRAGLEAEVAYQDALLAQRQAQSRLERAVGE
jgi:cobalt-zinc-cadmium efflux system outer membrane protein